MQLTEGYLVTHICKFLRVDRMENENEERGLDHLIEQNSTELGFLDIYGEGDDQGDE